MPKSQKSLNQFRTAARASLWLVAVAAGLLPNYCRAADGDQPQKPTGDVAEAATVWSLSPFGIGSCYTNNRSADDNARWMPQLAAIGVHVHRTPETTWHALEPVQGQWKWDALDRQVQFLEDHNVRFGELLLGTPGWNKLDAGGSLPVHNITGWSNYVTQVTRHLHGKPTMVEVWNEPPNFTGRDQKPADYAKIVVAAYDAVKAIDPKMPVALCAKSVDINYLEQTIKAGAKDHFDMIVLHPYEVLDGVADNRGSEAIYMSIVPTLRKMLAAQDPAKHDVPVVFTELGSDAGRGADRQASALVKAYVMGIAQGVSCIQWFEGRDGDSGPMGLLDGNGTPRPAYTALAQLIERLGQHPKHLGWLLLNNKHYAFAFETPAGVALCAWQPSKKPDQVDFGQPVTIIDPLTGHATQSATVELATKPILAIGVPQKFADEAKQSAGKPFPWNGDYSGADSVSINLGDTIVEKGLHTAAGADVAKAVIAYGGSARSGDLPGGNMFSVDPNFLSYTTTPIEITVVIRRNAANDNAGFNVIYESPTGYKSVGSWYTVPDNTKWHTKTWRIDDPQFVSMWGYNFTFNSDGNQYNKYLIQSVTVKKVDAATAKDAKSAKE